MRKAEPLRLLLFSEGPNRQTRAVPLVSVVLIFLNEQRFLEEAVRSVCDQTLADWELILVDDGSTDRSTQIARELAAHDDRIRYVDHPGHQNRGMAASRNFGAAHSTALYLGFLDGDDVWVPTKLAEQVDLLEAMPDVVMVNGAMLCWYSWDPASTVLDRVYLSGGVADRRLDPPEAALTMHPLARTDSAGVDLLVRRSVFDAVGGFEERFRGMFEDQSLLIKVFLRYPIYISSQVWIHYRQHDASECAHTTETAYLRVRGVFLDWLRDDVERLGDRRVSAALRRARRQLRYKKPLAPMVDLILRLLEALRRRTPDKLKDQVKRILPHERYERFVGAVTLVVDTH
jgi:glycosyltransferase involved in cell wall biosynthesis